MWSYGSVELICQKNTKSEIKFELPRLRAKSSIEVIISNWWSQINNEDIDVSYDKLKSLNKNYINWILWLSLIFSLMLSFFIVTLQQKDVE